MSRNPNRARVYAAAATATRLVARYQDHIAKDLSPALGSIWSKS